MQVKSLSVQGFRSFNAQQSIDFAALRPGLYHLAGRNEVEPDLQGNGAGKSSLLEAVCWGLYGRTSRNLRAGTIKHWGGSEKCAVILQVQTASHLLDIFRVWNPNTLEVAVDGGAPRPVDQRELDLLLGLAPEAFLFSIYFAQFAPAFIDLRPAEQMSVYSTIMGLNLWETASDAATRSGREAEYRAARLREDCARLEGQAKELAALSFDHEEEQWENKRQDGITSLVEEQKGIDDLITSTTTSRDLAAKGSKLFRDLREQVQEAAKTVALAEAEVRRIRALLADLKRKDIKTCPTCGQPVSNAHLADEVKKLTKEMETAKTKSDAALAEHDTQMKEMDKYRDDEVRLLSAEKKLSTLQTHKINNQDTIDRLKKETNPYSQKRRETAAKLKALNAQAEAAVAALEAAEAERGAMAFWSKGFKELRLSLIEESLAQLSIEANAALLELGLKSWALGFDVERETKSGSISKGFTTAVEAPHVGESVPWEAWSGGESQRLRIATSLGFGDLICSRMGLAPNVELWDEPSTWLSEAGIHDLLSALDTRARRRGKIILVADHRALDFGGFAGTINVTKSRAGSTVRVD